MPKTTQEKLLSLPDLADYLGVPVRTLYSWRTRREGPRAIKVGRALRFRLADVDRWIEEHADPEHDPTG